MSQTKMIVITGATSGIGFALAKAFTKDGHCVIGIGRNREKCEQSKAEIMRSNSKAMINFFLADLSSHRQLRKLSEQITEYVKTHNNGVLDVLINNAAAVPEWYLTTEEGYEMQFSVNHLAGFLLTQRLLPLLRESDAGRVITTSSNSHYHTKLNFNNIMLSKNYHLLRAYKRSKLCNVLFTYEFNRRFEDVENIEAYAVDPGLVNTDIGAKSTGGFIRWFWNMRSKRGVLPEDVVGTYLYLATSESILNGGVYYYKDRMPKEPSKNGKDEVAAGKLWELSERLCGVEF